MFKKSPLIVAAMASIALLPACSTIVNGSNQAVSFNTGDVTGADCTITGGSDNALNEKFQSPAEVKIPRSKKKLNVSCDKTGYKTAQKSVHSKVEGSTAGNILAGGVIGVGVDALTGAMYKYPDAVSIPMEATSSSTSSGGESTTDIISE